MSKLVNDLIRKGTLKSDLVIEAFWEIDRIEFVAPEHEKYAHADVPFPIGFGQTISQPMTVAIMLELLEPQRGQKILDVGSGSGWTTALLSYIVGEKGKVIGMERKKELMDFGRKNVDKFSYVKKGIAQFVHGDGSKGYEAEAPYDRILVSAMADCVPNELKEQVKIGGLIVIPINNSIWCMKKTGENEFEKEEYPGFAFVPLVEDNE